MQSQQGPKQLISGRWQELKKSAQNETDPDKLIAIIEEIDDLLFILERITGSRTGNISSKTNTDSGSEC